MRVRICVYNPLPGSFVAVVVLSLSPICAIHAPLGVDDPLRGEATKNGKNENTPQRPCGASQHDIVGVNTHYTKLRTIRSGISGKELCSLMVGSRASFESNPSPLSGSILTDSLSHEACKPTVQGPKPVSVESCGTHLGGPGGCGALRMEIQDQQQSLPQILKALTYFYYYYNCYC